MTSYGIPQNIINGTLTLEQLTRRISTIEDYLARADDPDYGNVTGVIILAITELTDLVESLLLKEIQSQQGGDPRVEIEK